MNRNRNLRSSQFTYSSTRKFSTALILYVFCLQLFTFTLDAQTFKKGDDVKAKLPAITTPSSEKKKIAPDLESDANELIMGSRSDVTQKVIIKLKPKDREEKVDNGILLSDFASQDAMNSKLDDVGGKLNESFSNMDMISAELPLSKIREIAQDENVEYISPDRTIQATAKKYSHYYKTTGALDGYSEVSGLNADGRGIGVAVLDSGIDITHKLIVPENGHPGVVFSKSFTGSSATDDKYGHGTHIASLLAGGAKFGKNAYGGIAPGVDLINLAVLDKKGRGTISTAIAAIDWVIQNKSAYNIRVINMSFGTAPVDSYVNDPLCQAVRRAFNAGIVVVVAAGNNGKDELGNKMYGSINSPGIEPSAITVGAANTFGTDYRVDDRIASYSSKGPTRGFKVVNGVKKYDNLIKPDLVAPGNKLISAISNSSRGSSDSIVYKNPTLDTRNSSKSGEGLMYMSGSSMAAPLVSGAVAMMLQANPNLSPNLVKATLMYTAQQMNGYNSFEQGAGLLNIEGAMTITKYIRSNVSSLSNGASMVTGSNYPWNTLGNETVYWGKGIITNHAMLFGENLMTQYQGMYGNGVLISDSTPFINGQLTRSLTLTTSGLNISSGSLTGNGVLMSDGVPFLHSSLMGDGTTLGTGVLISDGVLVSDGVMISDNVASLSVLGDATAGMELDD